MSEQTISPESTESAESTESTETAQVDPKAAWAAFVADLHNMDISDITDRITARYGDADRSGKARIRASVADLRDAAIESGDLIRAMVYVNLSKTLKSDSSKKSEIDPNVWVVARVATLRLAADLLESGAYGPTAGTVTAQPLDENGQIVLSAQIIADATIMASQAIVTKRGDVPDFIAFAMNNLEADVWHKVSAIGRIDQNGYSPSSGAISASIATLRESGKLDEMGLSYTDSPNVALRRNSDDTDNAPESD